MLEAMWVGLQQEQPVLLIAEPSLLCLCLRVNLLYLLKLINLAKSDLFVLPVPLSQQFSTLNLYPFRSFLSDICITINSSNNKNDVVVGGYHNMTCFKELQH